MSMTSYINNIGVRSLPASAHGRTCSYLACNGRIRRNSINNRYRNCTFIGTNHLIINDDD